MKSYGYIRAEYCRRSGNTRARRAGSMRCLVQQWLSQRRSGATGVMESKRSIPELVSRIVTTQYLELTLRQGHAFSGTR